MTEHLAPPDPKSGADQAGLPVKPRGSARLAIRRWPSRQSLIYIASLLEIAVATDLLVKAWSSKQYIALSFPLGLAVIGIVASLTGKAGAVAAIVATSGLMLAWRVMHTEDFAARDLLGVLLFAVTGLVLAGLALRRRALEHQVALSEQQARGAWEREAQLNRNKDDFLSLIAHELRNPVSVIMGDLNLLDRGLGSPEEKEGLIRDVSIESRRLHHLIEDLLALARLDTGLLPVIEPIRLQRLVPRVVEEFHQRYKNRVDVEFDSDLPLAAGSATHVERILANVLDNAGKYSDPAAPISIQAHCGEDRIQVDVLDRGRGIPEEATDLIFERFYRDSGATATRGYGLGLALSRRLIEGNQGHIWAHNREGGGLDIAFSLPLYEDVPSSRQA